MLRKYAKIEMLSDEIFRLKEHGKTHREIGELYGLTKEQIKGFVNRQNRKQHLLDQGYVPRPKGRPRKIFSAPLEGCDRKVSCRRTLAQEVSRKSSLPYPRCVTQRLLCLV